MRIYILTIFVSAGLMCCMSKRNEESATEMAIQDLKLGEAIHDSLSDEQIKKIEKIHKVFSEVNTSSLEQTITNFKRDQNPDNEIAIWLKMAGAYERFIEGRQVDLNKKKEAYDIILLRSMMTEKEVIDKVNIDFLTTDEVEEVFGYYDVPPQPVKIEKE